MFAVHAWPLQWEVFCWHGCVPLVLYREVPWNSIRSSSYRLPLFLSRKQESGLFQDPHPHPQGTSSHWMFLWEWNWCQLYDLGFTVTRFQPPVHTYIFIPSESHNHQANILGNILWKNGFYLNSTAPEICRINAKLFLIACAGPKSEILCCFFSFLCILSGKK